MHIFPTLKWCVNFLSNKTPTRFIEVCGCNVTKCKKGRRLKYFWMTVYIIKNRLMVLSLFLSCFLSHLGFYKPTRNRGFAIIARFKLQVDRAWADVGYSNVGRMARKLCMEAKTKKTERKSIILQPPTEGASGFQNPLTTVPSGGSTNTTHKLIYQALILLTSHFPVPAYRYIIKAV